MREGDRVQLDSCSDPFTKLRHGDEGTVRFVDHAGTVHIDWDNGASLGMVEAAGDRFHVVADRCPHGMFFSGAGACPGCGEPH